MTGKQHPLQLQQPDLLVDSGGEAYEVSVFADDAVAGDDDGNGVDAVGAAHGAAGIGAADFCGEVAVGAGGSVGDFLQGLPDLLLKGGACGAAFYGELCSLAGEVFRKLAGGFGCYGSFLGRRGRGGFGRCLPGRGRLQVGRAVLVQKVQLCYGIVLSDQLQNAQGGIKIGCVHDISPFVLIGAGQGCAGQGRRICIYCNIRAQYTGGKVFFLN